MGRWIALVIVLLLLIAVLWIEKDELPQPTQKMELDAAELDLLARAIYAEARGEPYTGQVAVGAVILNRVAHPDFPNTIAAVIYQPLAFQVVANGQIYRPAGPQAQQAARDAALGLDTSNGALYFFNPHTATSGWIRTRPVITRIGRHVFAI